MEEPQPDEPEVNQDEPEVKQDEPEDEWIGPLPTEATEPQAKKRKVLNHEKLFLEK